MPTPRSLISSAKLFETRTFPPVFNRSPATSDREVAPMEGDSVILLLKNPDMDFNESIADVLTRWERNLADYTQTFERYSRAMSELDTHLFEYVTKLLNSKNEQTDVELRQQEIIKDVNRVEAKQSAMLKIISHLEKRVAENTDRLEEHPDTLKQKAQQVNETLKNIENDMNKLVEDIDRLETKVYPDELGDLIHAINVHESLINKLEPFN